MIWTISPVGPSPGRGPRGGACDAIAPSGVLQRIPTRHQYQFRAPAVARRGLGEGMRRCSGGCGRGQGGNPASRRGPSGSASTQHAVERRQGCEAAARNGPVGLRATRWSTGKPSRGRGTRNRRSGGPRAGLFARTPRRRAGIVTLDKPVPRENKVIGHTTPSAIGPHIARRSSLTGPTARPRIDHLIEHVINRSPARRH